MVGLDAHDFRSGIFVPYQSKSDEDSLKTNVKNDVIIIERCCVEGGSTVFR